MKKFLYLLSLILLFSCSEKQIDVSGVDVDVRVHRLELALDTLNKLKISNEVPYLIDEFGSFLELYSVHVIKVGSVYQSAYAERLSEFFEYEFYDEIQDEVVNEFSDLSLETDALTLGFKHYRYYFPSKPIPAIYTYMGGMQQSIVIGDSLIGIGLEKYLGSDNEFYLRMQMELFKRKKMYRSRIPADCFYAVADAEFPFNFSDDNLLAHLINEGRKMFFVKEMLPETPDSVIWGYTGNELAWLENSEASMWNYMIDNEQLFSTDYMLIKRYTGEGPFIPQFSKQSPGKSPVWVGYRIISAYMENNPEIGLPELMYADDYHTILKKSKYNP